MTSATVQANKSLVWDYWLSCNSRPDRIADITSRIAHEDVIWHGPHPLNQLSGRQALLETFWEPFVHAFPDIKRRAYLFLGGEVGPEITGSAETELWVAGMGDYVGTFANDWLGIRALAQSVRMRFGEFNRMVDGQIVEIYTLFDLVSLIQQTGIDLLPPSRGRNIWTPGPMAGDGVLLEAHADEESKATLDLLNAMLFQGMQYDEPDPVAPSMDGYWTHDMVWHGPCGIGTVYGLHEFYSRAQGPIVSAHPDRIGGFHKARFAEGHCACMGGLVALQGTHTGEYLGMPPSGKRVAWRIMDFFTRSGDLLHEDWVLIDLLHVFLQCGHDLLARLQVK